MHADFLFIVAEIGAAFAGFASLVAVIATRSGRTPQQERLEYFTLRNVLLLSLLTIGFALLPNLVERQTASPETAWRAAAAAYVAAVAPYVVFTLYWLPRAYRDLDRALPFSFRLNACLIVLTLVSQSALVAGYTPPASYLIAVAVLLYCAGYGFVRLFASLRPGAASG